jgi:hypothetical protein
VSWLLAVLTVSRVMSLPALTEVTPPAPVFDRIAPTRLTSWPAEATSVPQAVGVVLA